MPACANGWRPKAWCRPRIATRSTRSPNTWTTCIARRSPTANPCEQADAIVEAELARMGPLAVAVADRAKRRQQHAAADRGAGTTGVAADLRHAASRDATRSRLLDDRDPDARHRHRRLHRGLQHHQRAAAGDRCPIRIPSSLALVWESDADNRAQTYHRRASHLRRLETRSDELFVDGHLGVPDLQRGVGRRARTGAGHSRHRQPVHGAGRAAGDRAASSPRRKRRLDTGSW